VPIAQNIHEHFSDRWHPEIIKHDISPNVEEEVRIEEINQSVIKYMHSINKYKIEPFFLTKELRQHLIRRRCKKS
jgi:hypothetical protein